MTPHSRMLVLDIKKLELPYNCLYLCVLCVFALFLLDHYQISLLSAIEHITKCFDVNEYTFFYDLTSHIWNMMKLLHCWSVSLTVSSYVMSMMPISFDDWWFKAWSNDMVSENIDFHQISYLSQNYTTATDNVQWTFWVWVVNHWISVAAM